MRKNEFYTWDINIDTSLYLPGYLGSFDNLPGWAYAIHTAHPDSKLKLTAKKVVHSGGGPVGVEIPPLSHGEIAEIKDKVRQGELAYAWLFTTLGLIELNELDLQGQIL